MLARLQPRSLSRGHRKAKQHAAGADALNSAQRQAGPPVWIQGTCMLLFGCCSRSCSCLYLLFFSSIFFFVFFLLLLSHGRVCRELGHRREHSSARLIPLPQPPDFQPLDHAQGDPGVNLVKQRSTVVARGPHQLLDAAGVVVQVGRDVVHAASNDGPCVMFRIVPPHFLHGVSAWSLAAQPRGVLRAPHEAHPVQLAESGLEADFVANVSRRHGCSLL
mmetsp:Transcript_4327/g.16951  ORF Transcript_4327/g.16951 Transcript_4327/m.16951 type:complete len:219 (+) Transcript_4327:1977-2633(+)